MNGTQRKGLQRFKKSCMVALLAAGLLVIGRTVQRRSRRD